MKTPANSFQWRALTTVVVALSFVFLLLSGAILFLAPPGRVANWTNWSILGLLKGDWTGLHVWFAAVFLGATAFHVFFNWRPLASYCKDRLTRRVGFRPEWITAAILCFVVAGGTLGRVPPFSTLLGWGEELKESWDQPTVRAPIPHAELLTLRDLAEKAGVPAQQAVDRLQAAGVVQAAPEAIVAKIAAASGRSAREIYDLIFSRPSAVSGPAEGSAGGGVGWKTLAQFCADEGIPVADASARLKAKGYTIEDGLTLRELAQRNGFSRPYQLLEIIRGAPPE